ncbi:hypothetical protein Tco_0815341 [Tanacetum coccineum]
MAAKIQSQDLEISQLMTRIKTLEDAQTTRGDEVFTTASLPVPPVSLFVPTVTATASKKDSTTAVITTTTAVTPYTRRTRASRGVVMTSSSPIPINIPSISKEDKGKGIMTEPAKPTKQKIARLHTKGELKMMINELDISNEVISKHLKEYAQAEDVLSLEDKIELITELAKYQKDLAQIKKYQTQQRNQDVKEKDSDDHDKIINLQQWVVLVRQESLVDITPSVAPKAYPYFEAMLKEFDRDDMVTLWKLVKDRVHCLIMEGMIINMLDDVEYPLPKTTLQKMLNHKCEVDVCMQMGFLDLGRRGSNHKKKDGRINVESGSNSNLNQDHASKAGGQNNND